MAAEAELQRAVYWRQRCNVGGPHAGAYAGNFVPKTKVLKGANASTGLRPLSEAAVKAWKELSVSAPQP